MNAVCSARVVSILLCVACLSSTLSCAPMDSRRDELAAKPPAAAPPPPPTKDNFLELFRAAELAALAEYDLVGTATFRAGSLGADEGRAEYAVACSVDGSTSARTMKLDGMPKNVAFIPPPPNGMASLSSPEYWNGNMGFWLLEEIAVIQDKDRSELLKAIRTYLVSPDGSVGKVERGWGEHTKGIPSDSVQIYRFVQMLHAGGRGFSECLTSITEFTERGEGLVLVRGPGSFPPTSSPRRGVTPQSAGEFELLVDVANGYLVREASFGISWTVLRVVTNGTIGQVPRTIARSGSMTYSGGTTITVAFDSMGRYSPEAYAAVEAAADRLAQMPFRNVNDKGERRRYRDGRLRD